MCPYILNIILQILDGILTFVGLSHLGIEGEGNPVLRSLMYGIGVAPALILAKVFACAVLYFMLREFNRYRLAMHVLNVVYGVSAFVWVFSIFKLKGLL